MRSYIEELVDFVLVEVAVDGLNVCEVFLADADGAHLGLDASFVSCNSAAHFSIKNL